MSMAGSDGKDALFHAMLPSAMDYGLSADFAGRLWQRLEADLARRCGGTAPRFQVAFDAKPDGDPPRRIALLRDGFRRLRRRNPSDSTDIRMLRL